MEVIPFPKKKRQIEEEYDSPILWIERHVLKKLVATTQNLKQENVTLKQENVTLKQENVTLRLKNLFLRRIIFWSVFFTLLYIMVY